MTSIAIRKTNLDVLSDLVFKEDPSPAVGPNGLSMMMMMMYDCVSACMCTHAFECVCMCVCVCECVCYEINLTRSSVFL